jgi:hypothetical protein
MGQLYLQVDSASGMTKEQLRAEIFNRCGGSNVVRNLIENIVYKTKSALTITVASAVDQDEKSRVIADMDPELYDQSWDNHTNSSREFREFRGHYT